MQRRQNKENDVGQYNMQDYGFAKTDLIVNYLPQHMKEIDLYTMFVTQGPVDYVRIMKDYKTGYSFGYGFVRYQNAEDAARALEALNGIEFQTKRLRISYARPPGQNMKDSKLYVTNLPKNITEAGVEKIFGVYGEMLQNNLLRDKTTGIPRGVAFVRYANPEDAQIAIQNVDGKILEGCLKPISVKIAEERGKQKAPFFWSWKARYEMHQMNQWFGQMRGYFQGRGYPNINRPLMDRSGRENEFNSMMGRENMDPQ